MNVSIFHKTTTRVLALLALAFGFGLLAGQPQVTQAQWGTGITPAGPAWCGVTDQGGTVRFELTSDLRFVDWIEIRQPIPAPLTISTLEGEYRGTGRAQIAADQFIFRRDIEETECTTRRGGGSSRCTQAPCRPSRCTTPGCQGGREVCETREVNEMMIRGKFKSPESVSGVYSVIVEDSTRNQGRAPVRVDREVGTYIAWPVGTAPCP